MVTLLLANTLYSPAISVFGFHLFNFFNWAKWRWVPKVSQEHVESEALEVEIILLTQECIILCVHTYFCCLKAGCLHLGNVLQPSTRLRCDLLSSEQDFWGNITLECITVDLEVSVCPKLQPDAVVRGVNFWMRLIKRKLLFNCQSLTDAVSG